MISTVQRGCTCRSLCSFGLAVALTFGPATSARAEVHVEGSLAAVRVTTSQDTIADVLSAFARTFRVQHRTAVPLDAAAVNKTYSGSFGQVVSRLLEGYNYMIKRDQETIEIIVLGRRGEVAIPIPAPATTAPAAKGILSRWR